MQGRFAVGILLLCNAVSNLQSTGHFDAVFIDEAGHAVEPEAVAGTAVNWSGSNFGFSRFNHMLVRSCDRTTFVRSIHVYFSQPPSTQILYCERQSTLQKSSYPRHSYKGHGENWGDVTGRVLSPHFSVGCPPKLLID